MMAALRAWFKKHAGKEAVLILAGCAGIVLLYSAFFSGWFDSETAVQDEPVQQDTLQKTEQRLSEILSRMEGAGQVEVMIHYDVAEDPQQTAAEAGASTDTALASEQPAQEADTSIVGVVVVAEGASDIGVRMKLYQAVQTALQVQAEQVEVFPANIQQEG